MQNSNIYFHKSIVNEEEVYRVWKNGDKVGEFKTDKEAKDLYEYLMKQEVPLQQELSEAQTLLFKKMFYVIGLTDEDYERFNFRDSQWYLKNTWTIQQEKEFSEWMEEMLFLNTKLRKAIMAYPSKSRFQIKKSVSWFILMYGWKTNFKTDNEIYGGNK